jgi:hypothetical protein
MSILLLRQMRLCIDGMADPLWGDLVWGHSEGLLEQH